MLARPRRDYVSGGAKNILNILAQKKVERRGCSLPRHPPQTYTLAHTHTHTYTFVVGPGKKRFGCTPEHITIHDAILSSSFKFFFAFWFKGLQRFFAVSQDIFARQPLQIPVFIPRYNHKGFA